MNFSKILLQDIPGLSKMHITCWNETYRGIIPDKYLDDLNLNDRINMWSKFIQNIDHFGELVRKGDEIVGFLSAGRMRGDNSHSQNEIFALYILKKYHRQGIGRELCDRFMTQLKISDVCAWVLEDNPACDFYKRMGGTVVDSRMDEYCSQKLNEILFRIER